jgi:hypothetical protein
MRLSEKTIELTFCHQVSAYWGSHLIWFGLTQAQERRAGFDAATRMNGRLLLLQFKASNHVMVRTGARRFSLPHRQLDSLTARIRIRRHVFYLFPQLGTTWELAAAPQLVPQVVMLDVANLPTPFPRPRTRLGTLRRSGMHYADLRGNAVTIHSKPIRKRGMKASSFEVTRVPSVKELYVSFREFEGVAERLEANSVACIIPGRAAH